jgi:ribosome biogenesis GTPase A
MEIKQAEFIISSTDVNKCPAAEKPEYAFIGRSNVGKSSLINMLTNTTYKPLFNQYELVFSRFTGLWLCKCFKRKTNRVC